MKQAFLVAGLAFGDEGKGATVDYLTEKFNAGLVIRYNGGCQAAHNVVTPDGRWHTFQQFGAGMFHPGVRTHLSRFMLVNPINMMREEEHLREVGIRDAWARTTVDAGALIITPFHRELNRLARTQYGQNDFTSCGQGIGICREFHLDYGDKVLFAGDLKDEEAARVKLRFIRDRTADIVELRRFTIPDTPNGNILKKYPGDNEDVIDLCWNCYKDWRNYLRIVPGFDLTTMLRQYKCVVFEGAQGVLLDEEHGSPGFNSWTNTTFVNANQLLDECHYAGKRIRVGVIRSYYTRHGAGPFPTEDPNLNFPEPHNDDVGFQGKFRRGHFDTRSFHDALRICSGVDMIAVNHLDQQLNLLPMEVNSLVSIQGHGPTYNDRILCPAE